MGGGGSGVSGRRRNTPRSRAESRKGERHRARTLRLVQRLLSGQSPRPFNGRLVYAVLEGDERGLVVVLRYET